MRPVKELAILPLLYGILVGCGFGFFEVLRNPLVIHKPAMQRYRESLNPKGVESFAKASEEPRR